MRWAVRVAVTAGIVGWLAAKVDLRELARTLADVRAVPFAWATALFLAGQLLSAWKWSMIARSLGFRRPVADFVRFYFAGMLFNLFGPSTLGGDVVRALYLGDGRRRAVAANTVLFDRVSGLVLLVAVGAVGVALFPGYALPRTLTLGMVAFGVALGVGFALAPRFVSLLPAGRLKAPLAAIAGAELAPLWHDGPALARIAAVSVVFHLSQVAVQWGLARAAGVTVPFSYCLIFHPIISLLTALPVSVSGFGVREGGYVYFYRRIGVAAPVAVTVSLLWFALTVVGALAGGAVFLGSGGQLPTLRASPLRRPDAA